MGVQHLWSILEQSKTEESIDNLRSKTLCIDLSLWICEAQGTKGLKDQLKPYLRNVFFRTLYLASLGVRPVFVVDGVPPEIKRETIVKRLEARGEHVANNAQKQRKLNRSKLAMQCNECCEMLGLLGIPFIKSDGEAEAMCAWLNENGYADGVLSDDGDVFLYGAKVVYKDFNISTSSKHPTNNLQAYRLDKIESDLGLTRRNMIALALLLGCDYLPAGVPGVGKETALKLFTSLPGVDLLERFHAWKSFSDVHPHDITSLEMAIKRKAVKVPDFPNKAVIKEFLSPKVGNAHVNTKWKRPDLEGIKEFFLRKLDWPEEYTAEKMLNLVTDWQLAHMNLTRTPLFCPIRIVKPRVKQGKEYYEIEWNTEDETIKLWPNTFVSVKPKEIICEQFPALVEKFESEIASKKSKGKTKKGKRNKMASDDPKCFDDLLRKISNIDLNENSKMKEHFENECSDDDLSRKTLLDEKLGEKPHFETHQDSENYDLEGNSLRDVMTSSAQLNEGEKSCAGGRNDNLDSNETENRVDFDLIKSGEEKGIGVDEIREDQVLATIKCEIVDNFPNFNSPTIYYNFKSVGSFSTPNENDNTSLNLADITVDQTFGSDLEAIDDLLTESLLASLQNMTPMHGCSSYSNGFSTSPDLFTASNTESQLNTLLNEDVMLIEDESFTNNLKPVEGKKPESSTTSDGQDRESNFCDKTKAKCLVVSPDTPLSRETTSLTCRLLKRFQTENRTNMVNMLRSISDEEELVKNDRVESKSTKPLLHHAKQNKKVASGLEVKNEPLTNISNTGKEMKSSTIKPSDVIIVLE